MLSIKIDTSSLKELQSQLGSIKKSLANRGMKKALGEMGKIFRDGLKREVPARSGLLKKSITFKVWKAKKNGQYMAKVGAKNIKGAALWQRVHFSSVKQKKYEVSTTAKRAAAIQAKGHQSLGAINPAHYLHLIDGGVKPHLIKTPYAHGNRNAYVKHPGFKGKGMLARVANQRGAQATAAAVASLEQSIREATISSG